MLKTLQKISGDKQLWVYTILLIMFSFLAVYSASSNLVNVYGRTTPMYLFTKHLIHVLLGLLIIFVTHKMSPRVFSFLSNIMMPVMVILLAYTLAQGVLVGGANASRWIEIPMLGSLQPSTIAFYFLMMFTARYFGKNEASELGFGESIKSLWLWVILIVGFIFPANFSTAALIFGMVVLISIIAGYPFKHLFKILGIGLIMVLIALLIFKAFPDKFANRMDTWKGRIERYITPPPETNERGEMIINDQNRQVMLAKIAIAEGGLFNFSPGKSMQKNFLPQSVSDFIYAIIIEEYGLFGGLILLFVYLFMGLRFFIISKKAKNKYYKLLVLAVGYPLIFQALINMAVATGLFPVTGQPLPLVSSGGTAIWMSSFAIGIILSVSRITDEGEQADLDEFVTE